MSILYILEDGTWKATKAAARNLHRNNFLICCQYGDWSGFRSLEDCLKQIPSNWENRPNGFYWIEER